MHEWSIRNEAGELVSNSFEIANLFNCFLKSKITNLKENIDKDFVEDPLAKLKSAKTTGKNSPSFSHKQVTNKTNKAPKNIKDCTSLCSAKKAIKAFVKTLPV